MKAPEGSDVDRPLSGLTVVEFAGSIGGAYCANLFALQGAEVLLVGPDTLDEATQIHLRRDVVSIEPTAVDWSEVDVVIDSSAPRPRLPHEVDVERSVHVVITPFSAPGPKARWAATSAVDYAVSGHAHLSGPPDGPPKPGPPNQPAVAAGLFGFIGAMAAILRRCVTGRGDTVRVSHHRAMVALHQMTVLHYTMTGRTLTRMGNRYAGQGQPNGLYACRDGWISITCISQPQIDALLAVTDLTELLDHPDIETSLDLQQRPDLLDQPLNAWLAERSTGEVVDLFQALRIPACPATSPLALLTDPHLVDRDFWQKSDEPAAATVPGPPFVRSHHQRVDQHSTAGWRPDPEAEAPLSGLRVLDLTRVWAGPLCTRILADLGADVVMVEAPFARGPVDVPPARAQAMGYFPDDTPGPEHWNRNGHVLKFALGKSSLAIDLQNDAGRNAFDTVVAGAHVLVENFTPRVMPQLGLDEDRLHDLNPELVYATMPGYGRSGPNENWLAYGSCIDSHAGLSHLIDHGDQPYKAGVAWPDPIAGLHACSAILASLWGVVAGTYGGHTIEVAQFEATIAAIGEHVVEAQLAPKQRTGREWTLPGGGDDRWIVVSAPDQAAIDGVFRCDGTDAGPGDAAPDDIEAALKRLAINADVFELAERLQAAGVPAAPVARAADLLDDPDLRVGEFWATVEQPLVGPFTTQGLAVTFDSWTPAPTAPAPSLGRDNRSVLARAGLRGPDIDRLEQDGVIVDRPPPSPQ